VSIELLIILLVVAFPLLQQLLEALRKQGQLPQEQAEQQTARAPLPSTEPPPRRVRAAPRHPAFDAAPLPAPVAKVRPAVAVKRRRRFARWHGAAELRRAIVLMTILEPCRAMDQTERKNGGHS
jgi:hypothetical protein